MNFFVVKMHAFIWRYSWWAKGIIIVPVVCWCETWFIMLMEEHKLVVFENRMSRSFMICTPCQMLFGWPNWNTMGLVGHMAWVGEECIEGMGKQEMHTECWWEIQDIRGPVKNMGRRCAVSVWTGFHWLIMTWVSALLKQ